MNYKRITKELIQELRRTRKPLRQVKGEWGGVIIAHSGVDLNAMSRLAEFDCWREWAKDDDSTAYLRQWGHD